MPVTTIFAIQYNSRSDGDVVTTIGENSVFCKSGERLLPLRKEG